MSDIEKVDGVQMMQELQPEFVKAFGERVITVNGEHIQAFATLAEAAQFAGV